jgi:hypothetical protein
VLAQFTNQVRQPLGPDPHLQRILLDLDPLHQELDDACLLGGEQLAPNRGEVGASPSPGAGDQAGVIAMHHVDAEAAAALNTLSAAA